MRRAWLFSNLAIQLTEFDFHAISREMASIKLLLLLAFLSCSLPIPAQEEGGSDSSGLHLTSETALYSADINLKEGEATEEEKKTTRKGDHLE